jgi:hypothetical protein
MKDFEYQLEIVRAVKKDDGLYIEGVASNTSVDKYETVFTKQCQEGFVQDIKEAFEDGKPLKIEVEHEGDEASFLNLGPIIDGELNNNETKITAILDLANPLSNYYYTILTSSPEQNRAMGRPEKLFFSIRGKPVESRMAYSEAAKKFIPHFDRVKLRKVGITEKPVNDECYADAIKRSLGYSEETLMSSETNDQELETQELEVNEVTEVNAEVTTEVVETDVERAEETEEANSESAADEEAEVGSDQVAESEEKKEVDAEEDTSGETVVETAEVVEEVRAEETEVNGEVVRAELKDLVTAREVSQKMYELNYAFTDTMYMILYSGEDNKVEKMRACVEDYGSLLGEIMSTKRALDTSDSALQKEDLDEKVELTYSLKEKFAARNPDVARALVEKEEDMLKDELNEIKRALSDINAKLETKEKEVETLRAEKEELETENKELENKVEELEKQPETTPVVVVEKDETKAKEEWR